MPSVWRLSGGAWFYFWNSYWLLVWAVQNLRLKQALNCNSLDALKLECQDLPSKLWGRLKENKNTGVFLDLKAEVCRDFFMEIHWGECCPQWDSTCAVSMTRVVFLQLHLSFHKTQQQELKGSHSVSTNIYIQLVISQYPVLLNKMFCSFWKSHGLLVVYFYKLSFCNN